MTLYFLYGSKMRAPTNVGGYKKSCFGACRRIGIKDDEIYTKLYKAYTNI